MSIAHIRRHVPYSQWRPTIFRVLFANGAQSPSQRSPVPVRDRDYSSSTDKEGKNEKQRQNSNNAEQTEAQTTKKRPPPKKWDPYSQQGRSDLQGVLQQLRQQLHETDFPSPEDAEQPAQLPQSPILSRKPRRRRQRPAKPQPRSEERALENDPWAAILAQPVRMEVATRARMPMALMTNWALVGHPDTDDVYVLPDALADLDALEKLGSVADQEQQTERADGTTATSPAEEKSKRSALLNPGTGPAIRLLPSAQLMDRLTQIYTFVERPDNPSSPRLMRRSVDLISILPQLWRERIARVRHYDSNQRQVEASLGNQDVVTPPPLEATINKTNLKWQPDIEHRLLNILRTRLAVCLKRVLHLASTSSNQSSNNPTASIQLHQVLPLMDLLRENDRRPSHPEAHLEPANRWGPYSPPRILLYFSDDPVDRQTLARLSRANPLITTPGIKPTTCIDESETALEKVPALLPPLLLQQTGNNDPLGRRVPLFPMRALLDQPQYNDLDQAIRQSTRDWLPWGAKGDGDGDDSRFTLSITADAPYADVLFAETWRLWRYVGGMRCMATASSSSSSSSSSNNTAASIV